MMSGAGEEKLELMGDVYIGPGHKNRDQLDKPELEGTGKEGRRGVITSLEELKYDEIKEDDVAELDHQARRRSIADAELEAREQRQRAAR